MNYLIQDLAGVICDGGKTGCAFKLAAAAGSAGRSALLVLQGVQVLQGEGIVVERLENTAQNPGLLSVEGMPGGQCESGTAGWWRGARTG